MAESPTTQGTPFAAMAAARFDDAPPGVRHAGWRKWGDRM